MGWELDCREFVRLCCTKKLPLSQLKETLGLIRTLLFNAANGETRDTKCFKPLVKRALYDIPFALDFFLHSCPFTRETSEDVAGRHEFVFRLKPDGNQTCLALYQSLDELIQVLELWVPTLTSPLRVTLESGRTLEGSFANEEPIASVKEWIGNHRSLHAGEYLLCALPDVSQSFDHDEQTVGQANLARQKLIVKPTVVRVLERTDRTEDQKKAEIAQLTQLKQLEFAQKQASKQDQKRQEVQKHVDTVKQFQEDRGIAELRAKRVIQREATAAAPMVITASEVVMKKE